MSKTLPVIATITVACCFTAGCGTSSPDGSTNSSQVEPIAKTTETVTLYIPEMSDKLALL